MTISDLRHSVTSERYLRRVPTALIEYPLEVLLSAWGLVSAPPILIGLSNPTSITSLLPWWIARTWAVFLFLGAVTIGNGLRRRRYGRTVPRGLQLLGTACLCDAIAIYAVVGWQRGIPTGPLLTIIAALCYLRAWWLIVRERILRRIDEASR